MDKKLFPCALIRAGEQSVRAEIPKRDSAQLGVLCDGEKEMDFDQFKHEIRARIQVGTIFDNPRKGTSVITSVSDNGISYLRGKATIYVSFQDLFEALQHFSGSRVSSTDLKSYKPSVFDSKGTNPGHSCNCTFLFMVLKKIGIPLEIGGQGIKGDPYFVEIPLIHNN
jgi:hypothetical protein